MQNSCQLHTLSETMNHQRAVSVTPSESSKGISQSCFTALSPTYNFLSVESEGKSLCTGHCSSAHPSPFIRKESLSSPSHYQIAGPNSPLTSGSHFPHRMANFSRSSEFCTSLYLSSSSCSETHRGLRNLPFLPHPSTNSQSIPAVDSAKSPLLFSEDIGNMHEEHSDSLMNEFLNLPGDSSDGSFHHVTCGGETLVLNEQLELQFLSDELDIAITDHGENPRLDVSLIHLLIFMP